MSLKVTEEQKRTIACPECGARVGKRCRGSRQPGANTFGGGWGGPPDLDRAHKARRDAYIAKHPPAPLVAGLPDAPVCRRTTMDEFGSEAWCYQWIFAFTQIASHVE